MRRAARVDDNQPAVVKLYRKLGCSVAVTSNQGDGFPDIVIGINNKTVLVEIKDPAKPPSKRKLTDDQVIFHENWKGDIRVVETDQDVINHVNELNCILVK